MNMVHIYEEGFPCKTGSDKRKSLQLNFWSYFKEDPDYLFVLTT